MQYGPKIVTNGLVLCLDAADRNSYSGSGTTWTDLSGNNKNGELVNSPIFNSSNGGNFLFGDSINYVITNFISPTSFTWIAWFRAVSISSGFRNIVSVQSPSYMLMLMDATTDYMGFWSSDGLSGQNLNMGPISTNIWYSAAFVREGDSITNGYKVYLNGYFKGSANTGIWSSSDFVAIASRINITSQNFRGNISSVQMYNRALSASEILQNFNATKNRFGI
jgi:hypothetical protein